MSAYVYAMVNQKGGIGKTTTAIHLGTGLKARGFKTLIIDMDAQCNLTFTLKGDYRKKPTIMDAILGKVDILDTIQHLDEVDVIPGSSNLASIESLIETDNKEFFLANAIKPLKKIYDFIVLDSPPALSLLTVGIMCASDSIVIPVGMDLYSMQGTVQLFRTFSAVKQYCNNELEIEGILVTQDSISLKSTLRKIADKMEVNIFDTVISYNAIVKHAVINQKSLYKFAPNSKSAKEFSSFVDELLEKTRHKWQPRINDESWRDYDVLDNDKELEKKLNSFLTKELNEIDEVKNNFESEN